MKKSRVNRVIYPLIENPKDRTLRVSVDHLDKRLNDTVYNEPLFKEHLTEVSIKLGVPIETVTWVIKGYTRNVLHFLHTKATTYTRLIVPNFIFFKLHSYKQKKSLHHGKRNSRS